MIMAPSMSLIAVAGVASGICFILFVNIRKRKVSKPKLEVSRVSDESSCACCLKPFIIVGSSVRCNECGCRSCRKGCSRWDTEDTAWHCLFCHEKRACQRRKEKWFDTFGAQNIGGEEKEEEEGHQGQGQGQGESRSRFRTAKSRVHVAGVEDAAATSGLDQATGGEEERNKMETLRDFIEKIVEGLIGSVDDSPIDRIYDHPEYDRFLVKYNVPLAGVLVRLAVCLQLTLTNKPCTDSPSMAHTALRELVERAVEEARKLPVLGIDNTGSRQEGRDITEHSYEDLLATAILNKVIEKIQTQRDQQQQQQQQQQHHHHHHHHYQHHVDDNSNDLLQLEQYSGTNAKGESALGCQDATRVEAEEEDENEDGEEEGEEKEEEECNGSLEALSQDDYSGDCSAPRIRSSRNHQEPLSLTIEERIEEITTTTYTSDDEFKDNDGALVLGHARLVPFPEYGMDIVDASHESEIDEESERSWQNLNIVMNPVESWEANWLFQKKKIKSQAEPVSMLVPNSSADFKALIGDKDAEDTSDLSECSSTQSDEEIEQELIEAINNVVPRSPVIASAEIYDGEKEKREFAPDRAKSNLDDEGFLEKYAGTGECSEESRENVGHRRRSSNVEMEFQEGKMDPLERRDVDLLDRLETSIRADDGNSSCDDTRAKTLKPREREEETEEEGGKDSKLSKDRSKSLKVQEEDRNLPKTPSSTPRTSTSTLEDVAHEKLSENLSGREKKQILDSLESAKRKLIAEEFSAAKENEDEAQQESEYTEHYELATRRHVDSLKRGRSIEKEDKVEKSETPTADHNPESLTDFSKSREAKATVFSPEERNEKFQLATPPRPGTIAEREHKKWENAPPIPNNPYSQENIQKRLWEKQYVKKPSDISGINAESTTDNENDSKVVLVAKQSDINRFSRDYYINNSKASSGDSSKKSSLIFNRPNVDHLEEPDPEKQEDVRKCDSEKLDWQKNNSAPEAESYYKLLPNRTERVDEFYENERKNSKNEINAKLNNQDDVLEASKSESQKIRRIDLKAYGFENEFSTSSNKSIIAPQRVVNKLDLKSFGYDSGVRRAQSTNQIDRIRKYAQGNGQEDKSNLRFSDERITRERNLAQSTETLNRMEENAARDFGTMSSAMSVPNISQSSCYQFGKMTLNDKSSRHDLNELSMPSVRRLAEVFDKSLEYTSLPVSKESKSTTAKERPSTPEILIVEPPKQMHSLTARSLSKQFREGLRQIPSKVVPPVQSQNHSFNEKFSRDKHPEEHQAIVPGKLKSNINFWEKMQKRS